MCIVGFYIFFLYEVVNLSYGGSMHVLHITLTRMMRFRSYSFTIYLKYVSLPSIRGDSKYVAQNYNTLGQEYL